MSNCRASKLFCDTEKDTLLISVKKSGIYNIIKTRPYVGGGEYTSLVGKIDLGLGSRSNKGNGEERVNKYLKDTIDNYW